MGLHLLLRSPVYVLFSCCHVHSEAEKDDEIADVTDSKLNGLELVKTGPQVRTRV